MIQRQATPYRHVKVARWERSHGLAMETDVTLRPGETFCLSLPARGTAGYSWGYEVSGATEAVEVRIAVASPPPHTLAEPPQGGSFEEQLIVKAVSRGEVQIHATQRRSWERDKPPLAERLVRVIVRA